MGLVSPVSAEVNLLRDIFVDAVTLVGQECSVVIYTKYADDDFNGVLSDPVTYNSGVFFDENPSVRTLKSLSWYTEDTDVLPCLLYLPAEMSGVKVDVRDGSKITIKYGAFNKNYRISSVRSPYTNVIYYTCKLTPWFDTDVRNEADVTFDPKTDDSKYNFLNVDK
jgi:hypothetical protein